MVNEDAFAFIYRWKNYSLENLDKKYFPIFFFKVSYRWLIWVNLSSLKFIFYISAFLFSSLKIMKILEKFIVIIHSHFILLD